MYNVFIINVLVQSYNFNLELQGYFLSRRYFSYGNVGGSGVRNSRTKQHRT
jgi:hypothetical protein